MFFIFGFLIFGTMAFNPQYLQIIRKAIRSKQHDKNSSLSKYRRGKKGLRTRQDTWNNIRNFIFLMLGVLSAGFGLEGFLIPNGLIDGGVTGISLLANKKSGISLSILIFLINIPFFLLAWKQIGKMFFLKSVLCIAVLAVVLIVVPYPIVTNDKVLIAVFGGFFLGGGIGLTIRGGAVIDGTEILAIYLSRNRNISVGDFIMMFNILIFSAAAYLYSVEMALYSILTYMVAAKTVDFILDGIEEFTAVTIISPRNEQIANFIRNEMERGVTVYTGKKGYGKRGERLATEIVMTVVTRLEISRLKQEVQRIDPKAFIVMQSVNDTHGGMVKPKAYKHDS
jgi:uncharacterized membrane-anchored protein YitT (DUF2179 family)